MTAAHPTPHIVIIASTGFAIRNYVLGGFLPRLQQHAEVSVLSPLAGQAEFDAAMLSRSVETRLLQKPVVTGKWARIEQWRQALHVAGIDTETWRSKRARSHRQASIQSRWRNSLSYAVARLMTGQQTLHRLDSMETQCALRSDEAVYYRSLFREHRPWLVFSASPISREEWLPIQVARELGIPTVLSILSWDNLSSKSRMPFPCSGVLVWSDHMRQELLRYYPELQKERIHITGAPQFDFHVDPKLRLSRTSFFAQIGADPWRPLIVYAGVTPAIMPYEPAVIEHIADAVKRSEIANDAQLLVRLHPKDDGSRYREFRAKHPNVLFFVPGQQSQGSLSSWQPHDDDVRLLVNTMIHGDVHINVASTMTLDAAIVDRPVINLAYDLRPDGTVPSWGLSAYEFTHYRPIIETGGVKLAHTPQELIQQINTYVQHPELDRTGRQRIVKLQCGFIDGKAGERAAIILLEFAGLAESTKSVEKAFLAT